MNDLRDQAPADLDAVRALLARLPEPSDAARAEARARQARLTKPPGSLGRLEDLAVWLAGWRGEARGRVTAPQVAVFAGEHGVATLGVSAYPPEVTAQMVAGFEAGGAAINQIARAVGAHLTVHPIELGRPTADFTKGPAMSEAEVVRAMRVGMEAVGAGTDLLVAGEMGIGNTTSAAALCHALHAGAPEDWVGRGTGVDDSGLAAKARAVRLGLAVNPEAARDPLVALMALGGREIAAIAGAVLGARLRCVPVILDGYIATAAAAVLEAARPGALAHCLAGHVSAEAPHAALLARLGLDPLLSLGMRLGEGTGAALAIPVLRAAAECQAGMATFEEAGVSEG